MELDRGLRLPIGRHKRAEDLDQVDRAGAVVVRARSASGGRRVQVDGVHVSAKDDDRCCVVAGALDFGDDGRLRPAVRVKGGGNIRAAANDL